MSNKFEQAIEEGLDAVQTYETALADIERLIHAMDQAVLLKTNGEVRIGVGVRKFNELVEFVAGLADLVSNIIRDEATPPRQFYIIAYETGDHSEIREVCGLAPSRAGYPVEVLSFGNTRTSCPDFESLEYKLADIMRDSRIGFKLRSLMNPAPAGSESEIGAAREGK